MGASFNSQVHSFMDKHACFIIYVQIEGLHASWPDMTIL